MDAHQHQTRATHISIQPMASLEGIISLGPWGGSGGKDWRFRASKGITEIIIYVDSNIPKAISFRDDQAEISGPFGGGNMKVRGEETKITIDWPAEYFTTISGTYGNYNESTVITSITFTTNKDTYGPIGRANGDGDHEFSIPIAESVVVGFHGRSGDYLDALGIFVQPVDSDGSISLGPWGGQGGSPYGFKAATWIKEITINDGSCINALTFKDANGGTYGKFGGSGSNSDFVRINGPYEYLSSISGTYGNVPDHASTPLVTSLSFITNRATYGPFGTANGTSFSIPIQGSLVNGFHGRDGDDIDSIGLYVKPQN